MPRAVRFRVPEGATRFDDLVHGPIEFDGANIEDFVILRSDGHPTYHLSVVSDDVEMEITHVVRGDDHISNTPKQILLYRALGATVPQFAHVPLILGPDKKRLSKRHGATSVMEYARQGYPAGSDGQLSRAARMVARRGDRELFTRDELVDAFSLEGISGGNAVFNPEKLDWFNQQHIDAARAGRARAPRSSRRSRRPGCGTTSILGDRHAWFFAVLELLKPRAKRLDDFVAQGRFFFTRRRSSTTRRPSQKHLRAPGWASISRRSTPRSRRSRRSMPASLEAALRADGRGARCESGDAHSCRAGSGDGKNGKSWTLRSPRPARP